MPNQEMKTKDTKDTMITFSEDGTLMEVPAIPICIICRELYDEVIGYDEQTQTCKTCRDREVF